MLNAHNVLQLGWQSAFGTANAIATRKLQNVSSFKLRPELETRALDQLRGHNGSDPSRQYLTAIYRARVLKPVTPILKN